MQSIFSLRRMGAFILFLIILISNMAIITPVKAIGVGPPGVYIMFAEGQHVQEADVRPGESGLVTFSGTVDADLAAGGEIEEVMVVLVGSTDKGWSVSITPSEIKLEPGRNEAPFTATVTVPQRTTYYTSGTLTISGNATFYPGNNVTKISPISGTIFIKQFYEYSVSCSDLSKTLDRDDEVDFDVIITNTGNARDKYGIEIINLRELVKDGFKFEFHRQLELDPDEARTVEFTVKTEKKVKSGEHLINLSIKSVQEELNEGFSIPQRLTLTITSKGEDEDDQEFFIFFLLFVISIIIVIVILIIIIGMRKKKQMYRPPPEWPRYD